MKAVVDCPMPESEWKPVVNGPPPWAKEQSQNQLELFAKQIELFRAGMPRGNHDAAVPAPPDGDPVRA